MQAFYFRAEFFDIYVYYFNPEIAVSLMVVGDQLKKVSFRMCLAVKHDGASAGAATAIIDDALDMCVEASAHRANNVRLRAKLCLKQWPGIIVTTRTRKSVIQIPLVLFSRFDVFSRDITPVG